VPTRPALAADVLARLGDWPRSLGVLAVLVGLTAVVCLVYWPGQINDDTIGIYEYARRGLPNNDWHSAFYTAMWRVFIVAGLRSLGWALAAGVLILLVGLYLVLRARLSRPAALLGAAAVFAFPPVLGFGVALGTDAWFAASILAAFGFVLRAARTSGPSRTISAVLAVALAYLAVAARPTSLPAAVLVVAALAVVMLQDRLGGWRRLLRAGIAGVAGGLLLYGSNLGLTRFVMHADQVHPEQETYKYDLVLMSVQTHQVLLPREFYQRQDVAYLAAHSDPTSVDPLLWGWYASIPPFVQGSQFDTLQRAWLSAIRHHPADYLRTRLNMALWQLTIAAPPQWVFLGSPAAYNLPPPNPALYAAAQAYMAVGTSGPMPGAVGSPLQRVWIYLLVLLGVVVLALRSRRRIDVVLALLAAALLLYTAEVLVAAPIVTYRYMYPAVVVGTVLFLLLAAGAATSLARLAQARLSTMLQYGTSSSSS